ncbi:MAG TPA: cobalt ECF transporter T component CbiQ [Bacillus bacterium]|nr:cobalt ECF transporter T component CbiQ [Bacillus sp. (in: firmicutes)]
MNFQLDTMSYKSHFRNIAASYKIIFTFLLVAITYISHVPVQLFVFVGVVVFLLCFAKIPILFLCRWLVVPSLFLLISMPALVIGVSQMSATDNDVLFPIITMKHWQFYISKTGLQFAYSIICRAISVFICVFALFITTPFNEILQALHKIGVPQVLLDVLVSMYRFIFIFFQYVAELNLVVASRLGNLTWKRKLHSVGLVVVQLFFKTFEKYKRMTFVVESRGFTDRFFYPEQREKKVPWTFVCSCICVITLLIGLEWWWRNS